MCTVHGFSSAFAMENGIISGNERFSVIFAIKAVELSETAGRHPVESREKQNLWCNLI